MNPNVEYEKFTREIYQGLLSENRIKAIQVLHNVKLLGKSGQKHQIDVYWEYELDGIVHRVAIECKNYNKPVSVGAVTSFYGVLADLDNVRGMMVTTVGYQRGAKKYAAHYGINLKELRRLPIGRESIIGTVEINIDVAIAKRLFLLDPGWIDSNEVMMKQYRDYLMVLDGDKNWLIANYLPLETTSDADVCDKKGVEIKSFDELENQISSGNHSSEYVFNFEDAYVNTRNMGRVKINAVKYVFVHDQVVRQFDIDARFFIKAILKDALNGEIKVISKDPRQVWPRGTQMEHAKSK